MNLSASATRMLSAASPEEPAARQPLAPVELSPNARQRAHVLSVTVRPRVRLIVACRRMRGSAARADLDDQPAGHDAYEYPQILSRTAITTPIRSATTKRMPAGVVLCHSDGVSGWHQHSGMAQRRRLQSRQTGICANGHRQCHPHRSLLSQQATLQLAARKPKQAAAKGGSQKQEQRQQQQNSEGSATAATTAVRSQEKKVRYVGLAMTDGGAASIACAVMSGA